MVIRRSIVLVLTVALLPGCALVTTTFGLSEKDLPPKKDVSDFELRGYVNSRGDALMWTEEPEWGKIKQGPRPGGEYYAVRYTTNQPVVHIFLDKTLTGPKCRWQTVGLKQERDRPMTESSFGPKVRVDDDSSSGQHKVDCEKVKAILAPDPNYAEIYGENASATASNKQNAPSTSAPVTNAADKDLVAAAAAQDDLKTFSRWLGSSGLGDKLHESGPFTVFAFNDASLAKLPADAQKIAETDPQKLRKMMNRFVVAGSYPSASMERSNEKPTLDSGYSLSFGKRSNGTVEVLGDKVLREIAVRNGVLYVVNSSR
jgi:uncharacterized surface protein with fasciclin (FAS1) repeats